MGVCSCGSKLYERITATMVSGAVICDQTGCQHPQQQPGGGGAWVRVISYSLKCPPPLAIVQLSYILWSAQGRPSPSSDLQLLTFIKLLSS